MLMIENETIFCIECKSSIECCFCSCSYCGEIIENCHCNLEDSRENDKTLSIKHYPKLGLLKQSKKLSFVNTKDDVDWRRLEKWQIGRRNFP